MVVSNSFKELYDKVSKYSEDIRKIEDQTMATGHIDGCRFRIFQEKVGSEYSAWVGIQDENAVDSMWSAFYTPEDIDKWYNERVRK